MTRRALYSLNASTAAALVALMAHPAAAQTTAVEAQAPADDPTAQGEPAAGEDIVVTATRTGRSGYDAPTPTTVLTAESIRAAAPASLADYVNQLPTLAGSVSPRNNNGSTTGGTAGANLLNLRGLGPNRTLVLLDGRRVAPSTLTGAVDVNVLPSAMVKRVDVVTGGASAAWGSDAVAGVVNFILDDTYTGLKGEISKGVTQRGDGQTFNAELTGGLSFADGRGHVVVSGQYSDAGRALTRDRSWYDGSKIIQNPAYTATNGQPQFVVASGVGLASATDNGLITGGPLRGIQFGADGLASPTPFNFGYVAGLQSLSGSAEDQGGRIELSIPTKNYNFFGHASYDVTDSLEVYAEASYARSEANYLSVSYNRFNNLTISVNNAYLDPAVRTQLLNAGQTSFVMGTSNFKFGQVEGRNVRELERYLGGIKGDIGGWRYNAYYQRGISRILSETANNPIVANYNRAVDARNVGGAFVCAVNADASTANDDPACAPFNVFGNVPASAAARGYVFGTAWQAIRLTQDVVAGSISGEPFSTWAGPVSVAVGGEYRKETFSAVADPISRASASPFFVGNYKESSGSISVREGFAEVVLPLLKDLPFAKDLSFNGAIRYTDYSTSGGVTTWKAGLTWEVSRELRFRALRSRDIRAPNLNELYQGGQASVGAIFDPVLNSSYNPTTFIVGNANLVPERADTFSLGVGYRPDWLPGFAISVDYYDIKLKDAIVTLSAQNQINGCAAGVVEFCSLITRNSANQITQILTPGLNFSRERVKGVDIEATYTTQLGSGRLNLSALANYVHERNVDTGFGVFEYAGTSSENTAVPRWRGTFSATYTNGGTTVNLRERFIGAGKYTNLVAVADNHVSAAFYTDLTITHKFEDVTGKPSLFVGVENLFDQDPRVSPLVQGPVHINSGVNGSIYDVLGRRFRVGFRFDL